MSNKRKRLPFYFDEFQKDLPPFCEKHSHPATPEERVKVKAWMDSFPFGNPIGMKQMLLRCARKHCTKSELLTWLNNKGKATQYISAKWPWPDRVHSSFETGDETVSWKPPSLPENPSAVIDMEAKVIRRASIFESNKSGIPANADEEFKIGVWIKRLEKYVHSSIEDRASVESALLRAIRRRATKQELMEFLESEGMDVEDFAHKWPWADRATSEYEVD